MWSSTSSFLFLVLCVIGASSSCGLLCDKAWGVLLARLMMLMDLLVM